MFLLNLIYAFFIERTHSLEINCVFKLMTIKYCEGLLKKHPGTIMNDKKTPNFLFKVFRHGCEKDHLFSNRMQLLYNV